MDHQYNLIKLCVYVCVYMRTFNIQRGNMLSSPAERLNGVDAHVGLTKSIYLQRRDFSMLLHDVLLRRCQQHSLEEPVNVRKIQWLKITLARLIIKVDFDSNLSGQKKK